MDMNEERFLLRIIEQMVLIINKLECKIMSALTDLQSAVAADTTAIQSAITLLNGLKAALDAAIASGDPAALQALSIEIGQNTSALAAAVAHDALPPVAPPPPVTP